mmetsp:Transcript_126668/g.404846  ORF Transcript_126668/g.404846 Transcript_126668/m.404846 type:complete len:309 (-) Transcript_126668:279-1205(-)
MPRVGRHLGMPRPTFLQGRGLPWAGAGRPAPQHPCQLPRHVACGVVAHGPAQRLHDGLVLGRDDAGAQHELSGGLLGSVRVPTHAMRRRCSRPPELCRGRQRTLRRLPRHDARHGLRVRRAFATQRLVVGAALLLQGEADLLVDATARFHRVRLRGDLLSAQPQPLQLPGGQVQPELLHLRPQLARGLHLGIEAPLCNRPEPLRLRGPSLRRLLRRRQPRLIAGIARLHAVPRSLRPFAQGVDLVRQLLASCVRGRQRFAHLSKFHLVGDLGEVRILARLHHMPPNASPQRHLARPAQTAAPGTVRSP